MIYFDNAATSFPKPRCVYEKLEECIKSYCGNPGRSSHALSRRSDEEIYNTRELVSRLLGLHAPERVVFTQNATHALNLAIKTTVREGSHVIISDIEHNSVIRPLNAICKNKNVSYSVFSLLGDVRKNLLSAIKPNTETVICNLLSNVNGELLDMKTVSDVCREKSLKFIADASQKIGHIDINLDKTPCDILCAPGHKGLFGIQGAGFAVICDNLTRDSFIEGGSGTDSNKADMPLYLPERYEAGTLPTPSIVTLGAGIDFIHSVGIEEIYKKINFLTELLVSELESLKIVSYISGKNGVISFTLNKIPPMRVAQLLDDNGICVRAGLHCAPLIHKRLGTDKNGSVRISLSFFNTKNEIYAFLKILKEIIFRYV